MTSINSDKTSVNKGKAEVLAFLGNANNHEKLMPSTIYNWSSTEDECRFTIQNMAKLALKITERNADAGRITIVPSEKAPFDLKIEWLVEGDDQQCVAQMIINADLNPFIKMMAIGPLTSLVNHQAKSLSELLK